MFFMALARGCAFPDQAPNLTPNRRSGDHFGKGRGGVGSLTGQCCFCIAPARESAFPNQAPDLTLNRKSGNHFGKGGGGVGGLTAQMES